MGGAAVQHMLSRLARRSVLGGLGRRHASTWGCALDIDGVVLRGGVPVQGAAETIRQLQRDEVPHIFLTNGSGTTEQQKADSLTRILGLEPEYAIKAQHMQLASTPMRALVDAYQDDLVVFVGKSTARDVAELYGFQKFATSEEFHSQFPLLYPDIKVDPDVEWIPEWHERVAAVFVVADPIPWGRDIQIVCDLAQSTGLVLERADKQMVPVYFSTPDFEYMGECSLPRLGNGSFTFAVQATYRKLTGVPLECTVYGKPHAETYAYATETLDVMAQRVGKHLTTIYGVGDNPLTDIRGANNAGGRWKSVLTRTGMFQGTENDEEDPAHLVVEDLLEWYETARAEHPA